MPIKFDTFDINNIVMSLWQAISSNTHRLENYIKYCLVDSNRGMHPNFRQVKIGGGGVEYIIKPTKYSFSSL